MEVTHKPGEAESLKLYAKAQALLMKVYPTFQNYPRVEHHQLCATIKTLFARLLEHIALAKYATSVSVRMAACQRFVRDACLRTERIRFADNERFIILG